MWPNRKRGRVVAINAADQRAAARRGGVGDGGGEERGGGRRAVATDRHGHRGAPQLCPPPDHNPPPPSTSDTPKAAGHGPRLGGQLYPWKVERCSEAVSLQVTKIATMGGSDGAAGTP